MPALAEERSQLEVNGRATTFGDAEAEAETSQECIRTDKNASGKYRIARLKVFRSSPDFARFHGKAAINARNNTGSQVEELPVENQFRHRCAFAEEFPARKTGQVQESSKRHLIV